jgi:hypothetical protein
LFQKIPFLVLLPAKQVKRDATQPAEALGAGTLPLTRLALVIRVLPDRTSRTIGEIVPQQTEGNARPIVAVNYAGNRRPPGATNDCVARITHGLHRLVAERVAP